MRPLKTLLLSLSAALLISPAIAGAQAPRHARRCGAAPHSTISSMRAFHRARVCSARNRNRHALRRERRAQAGLGSATAAQSRAALIAAVLATPCQNTEAPPEAGNLPVIREAVLCLVNQVRAQHGVEPLTLNEDLNTAAGEHSHELVEADYFAHIAPDGETPVERIRSTGYIPGPSVGYVIGENLAWGTYSLATPASIVAAWVASPGHLANILESQYRETGIGITPQVPSELAEGSPGATYAQEFGVIIQ